MTNVYEVNLPEGHDDLDSPNFIPFSSFNKTTMPLSIRESAEQLGLSGIDPLEEAYNWQFKKEFCDALIGQSNCFRRFK